MMVILYILFFHLKQSARIVRKPFCPTTVSTCLESKIYQGLYDRVRKFQILRNRDFRLYPVSYTHLDVYKRQVYYMRTGVLSYLRFITKSEMLLSVRRLTVNAFQCKRNSMLWSGPVSYTHLDVYKRQAYTLR